MNDSGGQVDISEAATHVKDAGLIDRLLTELDGMPSASLVLENTLPTPVPVRLAERRVGEHIKLDITPSAHIRGRLRRGYRFWLLRDRQGIPFRTSLLVANSLNKQDSKILCRCTYPDHLELFERREALRVKVPAGIGIGVILQSAEARVTVHGQLKDLSATGCLVEVPAQSVSSLQPLTSIDLELWFPNGHRFFFRATGKRFDHYRAPEAIGIGLHFQELTPAQTRQLRGLLHGLVLEAERQANPGSAQLPQARILRPASTSPWRADDTATPSPSSNVPGRGSPIGAGLAPIASWLDSQSAALQRDAQFQVEELENKAEQLLQLHDEDREALLFAARCFTQAAAPVRHGLAVAAEMIDLVAPTRLPRPVRRSIAACAMVHDLGKALYDEELRSTAVLTLQQRRDVPAHVFALERSLSACPWLSANVAKAVVWSINERLDGSGYPAGLQGEEIGELARAAMVVDVIDAMRRGRADRPAWKVAHIYANLRRRPTQFDRNWVNRYSRRFGSWPIGTLVRFESHALGWIRRLDAAGRPKQVQLAHDLRPPEALDAEVLDGERLEQLGAPSEQLPVAF